MMTEGSPAHSINWHVWMNERAWRDWLDALNFEANRRGIKRWPRPDEGGVDPEEWRENFFEKGITPFEAIERLTGETK